MIEQIFKRSYIFKCSIFNCSYIFKCSRGFMFGTVEIVRLLRQIKVSRMCGKMYRRTHATTYVRTHTTDGRRPLRRENFVSISYHIEWDMIVVTVFLSTLNQMKFQLGQNRKEYCHHDHIPFNVIGNGNSFLGVTPTLLLSDHIGTSVVATYN